MAEAALLAGSRWIVSPIVKKIINDARKYLGKDMEHELEDLETTVMPQFKFVIEAAERSPRRVELERWLWKLKTAFYDAEDLLDMHEYKLLQREATFNNPTSSTSNALLARVSAVSNLLPANRKLLRKLKELKNILVEAKNFYREFLSSGATAEVITGPHTNSSSSITTTSLPTSKIFDRDADRDHVVSFLCNPDDADTGGERNYSTFAIVGLGAEILESATKKNQHVQSANLNNLQCTLRGILQESQRFLLVLDDVWFDGFQDEEEWAKLLAPLVSQQRGSQVLNMKDTEFLALFKYHAFAGAEIKELEKHEKLQDIAGQIAQKLGQSPLAAKVVGSQLSRNMTIAAWEDALKRDNLGETRGALLWSYQNLDPNIQRCFMYCSLFPKGHMYERTELVHLWVAEGFADSSDQSRTLEDIGKIYFSELVSAYFLQPVHTISRGVLFNMHDNIHDLAETLSCGDCCRLEDSATEIPDTIRHLSVSVVTMEQHKQSICKLVHLRTVICMEPVMDDANKLFHEVLHNLKKLRVLLLCFHNGKKLPQSIGELKHLRYLNIFKTSISELPAALCSLYHLQFLRVHQDVNAWPVKICNLSKLRHLERCSHSPSGLIGRLRLPQIPYIGRLTKLQSDVEFYVAKQRGHGLRQLRDMKELSSILEIGNLENVRTKDEASEAMLHNKSKIWSLLHLSWSCMGDLHIDDSLQLEVLEGLKPPHELHSLGIDGYRSHVYPSWLCEDSHIANLKSLCLRNCTALEGLPSGVQLIQHFYRIVLDNIPNLKTLPHLPGGLGDLEIKGCPLLILISSEELGQHEQHANLMKVGTLSSQLAMI
uniref:Rx N-terminal domain-containing protein n=1 Tax=Oryza meridionalis TaxID=40149 RepID=A0A0E0F490_9ORYZ